MHRDTNREDDYRLVHEGSLLVLLQPLASAFINHPVEGAKIPAGACYQKTTFKFSLRNTSSKLRRLNYILESTKHHYHIRYESSIFILDLQTKLNRNILLFNLSQFIHDLREITIIHLISNFSNYMKYQTHTLLRTRIK